MQSQSQYLLSTYYALSNFNWYWGSTYEQNECPCVHGVYVPTPVCGPGNPCLDTQSSSSHQAAVLSCTLKPQLLGDSPSIRPGAPLYARHGGSAAWSTEGSWLQVGSGAAWSQWGR